jgi:uncharacterized protein YuzE
MDIQYDTIADAVYVSVGKGEIARTVKNSERFLVDVDKSGNVVGIEILDASSQQDLVENLKKNVEAGVPVAIVDGTPTLD